MAERVGVYTAFDYADIMEFLNKKWKVRGHSPGPAHRMGGGGDQEPQRLARALPLMVPLAAPAAPRALVAIAAPNARLCAPPSSQSPKGRGPQL